jgi:hypothetical protein
MKKRVREEEKKEENGFEIVNWKFVHGLHVRPIKTNKYNMRD